MQCVCKLCKTTFRGRKRLDRKYNVQPFCSKKCFTQSQKGKRISVVTELKNGLPPWNKGIPHTESTKQKISVAHHGKPRPWSRSEGSPVWKGSDIGKRILHLWIGKLQSKLMCGCCNRTRHETRLDFANISGEYKRDIGDFLTLCRKCHFQMDRSKSRECTWHRAGITLEQLNNLLLTEKP